MNNDELDPELEAALEEQQALAESSLAAVFEAYDSAIEQRVPRPVVWVVDCEDEVGASIAQAWVGEEVVEEAIATADGGDDETIVFTAAFSWEDCQREVPELFPYLAPVFAGDPPEDGVMLISVTSGGASVLTAPLDARPE